MEDTELRQKLDALEQKMVEVERMTKRMYMFFLWTVIGTVAMFVLPLIGLLFVLPSFISTYSSMGGLLQ